MASSDSGSTTLGDLIAFGEREFKSKGIAFGQGTLSAWDEARWLALATLDLPIDSPAEIESRRLQASEIKSIKDIFTRRIKERLPAAYLTGKAWLKGYSFRVDSRVIIPRSFIAELLLNGFAPWIERRDRVRDVLDLCTGSGSLAIIAADRFKNSKVLATDISDDALAVAQLNIDEHRKRSRIRAIHSDVFDALDMMTRRPQFDLIISNPPYVPKTKRAALPAEFRQEPSLALFAEDAGVAIVRRILARAAEFLRPAGVLAIEIGHEKKTLQTLLAREFSSLKPHWVRTAEQFDNVLVVSRKTLLNHPWRPMQ